MPTMKHAPLASYGGLVHGPYSWAGELRLLAACKRTAPPAPRIEALTMRVAYVPPRLELSRVAPASRDIPSASILDEWAALQHALLPGQPFSATALHLLEVALQPGRYDPALAAPSASRFRAILLMHATLADQAAAGAASHGAPTAQELPGTRAATRASPLRDHAERFTAMLEGPYSAPVLAHFPA
jgi:hypothetical protein